jgi:uncharacterized repeat protein (TIGR03803 family)
MKNTQPSRNWISRMRPAGSTAALALAIMLVSVVITTQPAQAQTFTTLQSFDFTDGSGSYAALAQGVNGDFYGISMAGGANSGTTTGYGTVFKMTPSGVLTALYNFCGLSNCADGYYPNGPLVLATNGDFYGTTQDGGANGYGTIFKITPSGTLTTLYNFCSQTNCTDGANPYAGLIQATNGNLYGTTYNGGAHGGGTVFKITPTGTPTTVYSFCSQSGCADGGAPWAGLIQATDGNFYGTTYSAGAYSYGTAFKLTPAGTLTTLHAFCSQGIQLCADGANPRAGLVQATNGNFYGTTSGGGVNGSTGGSYGTIFEMTPTGTLAALYSFCSQSGCTDGWDSYSSLIQATDGNLYGTTYLGGADSYYGGIIYKVTPSLTLTTLFSFDYAAGAGPTAALVQATSGTLYGATLGGGSTACSSNGCGTIFTESLGLGPFVQLQTTSGKEGAMIGILGQGFSSSSVVKFGGTQATAITRTGATFIKATVPAAALTGAVTVTTGTRTLTSSQTFRVTPTVVSFSPPSGPVGTPVTITGTGLMQATKVTFNGKSAAITVNSDTQITATVPTGATTGNIMVMTPGGSAISATSFTVN